VEKLLERLEKRVRGALARIDELGQENDTLKLRIDELTMENVRLSTEILDKDSELGDIEELRSRLEDSQARQELVRLRLNDIIAELDTALGIEEGEEEDSEDEDYPADEPENEVEQESVGSFTEPPKEESVDHEIPDDDPPPTSPHQIQPITEVEWGTTDGDDENAEEPTSNADEQTEMVEPEDDTEPTEKQEEQENEPPPELKDDSNPLGLFGGVLDRKTDADAD